MVNLVDTTPNAWLETEADQSTLLQPLLDIVSNLTFMLRVWWNDQKIEDYENYLYLIGLLLSLFILWRISRGEQVRIDELSAEDGELTPIEGPKSPLIELEASLSAHG